VTAEAVGVVICLGRTYALTMLYNLNYRSSLRHGPAHADGAHNLEPGNTMNFVNIICECLPGILELPAEAQLSSNSQAQMSIIHLLFIMDHQ